jgi:hypothetical protein
MGILLLLVGLLGLVSGGLKLRARVRSHVGAPLFALAETAVGALIVIASAAGLSRARPIAWVVVVLGLALVLVSTSAHVHRAVRQRRGRDMSEGERLQEYLRSRETP